MAFRLTLFGAFQAQLDGEPLPVRGDIPRAIVARLATEPGVVLAADELIAALWEDPPPTVLSSLRAHISRLRGAGWDAVFGGGRRGYAIEVDPDAVDVVAYARLVRGETGGARGEALLAAERLWRGSPYAGLAAFPFVPPRVEALEALRRTGLLELGRAQLDRGDHGSVPQTLAPALAARPDDPELLLLHVRALARAGRTGDALDALDAHRARLVESLGIEPAPELAELRQAIVRQDPVVMSAALGATAPVERVGIPIPLTRFVGRRRELELIERARSEARLITLVGPAGVGKTRLAIEAARRTTSAVDDEQWLVDLAVVTDPARVIPAIADVLGVREHTPAQVAERLRGRRALLILDNAEHVLGAVAAAVTELVARCEGLTVLVTSREALRMPGERLVAIEPLVGDAAPDAVRLFLQRASDTSGIAEWSEADVATAAQLCRALDGLPLALELAAARLDVLSLPEVASSVDGFGHSTGGRHDSIADALDWSIALLAEPELAALRQLALFAGSFSLDAVAAVVDVPGHDARELVVALTRKSLVSSVTSETGGRRFRLLESVLRHVRDRHPAPEADAFARRREQWIASLVADAAGLLKSHDHAKGHALLAESRPDIAAALEGVIARGDRGLAFRIAGPQAWYWYERSLHVDGKDWLERILALPGDRDPLGEAQACKSLAYMAASSTDPAAIVASIERMSSVVGPDSDAYHRMIATLMRAYLAALGGQPEAADALLDAAARIRDEEGVDDFDRGDELLLRGEALRALGRPAQALDFLADGYRTAVRTGNTFALKASCYVSAKSLIEVRRAKDALPIIRTGLVSAVESEDWPMAVSSFLTAAAALGQLERHVEAAEFYGMGDGLGVRFGFAPQHADPAFTARHRASVEAALTDAEWRAAWERGSTVTLPAGVRRMAALV